MKSFRALALAMVKGFYRDKMTVFFTVFFPLFFIVIFGLVFGDAGQSKEKLIPIGSIAFVDQLPAPARVAFDDVFELQPAQDRESAIESVRKGDVAGAIEQQGDQLVVHLARADQVAAATVQGVLSSFVDNTNVALSGTPPKFTLDVQQVEDQSLKGIQYVAPGMISYGITVGATFGAAMTLISWRQKKLLRRLRLAPVSTATGAWPGGASGSGTAAGPA